MYRWQVWSYFSIFWHEIESFTKRFQELKCQQPCVVWPFDKAAAGLQFPMLFSACSSSGSEKGLFKMPPWLIHFGILMFKNSGGHKIWKPTDRAAKITRFADFSILWRINIIGMRGVGAFVARPKLFLRNSISSKRGTPLFRFMDA